MREIIIACTFRDFDGSVNAKAQQVFLERIKNQTYKNYKLVVTGFGEKFVKRELEKFEIPHIYYDSKNTDILFSWGEVVANGIKHLEYGKSILLFSNGDVLFDPNLFEEIINHFEPGVGGTTYPNLYYKSLEDLKNNLFYDPYHNKYLRSIYQYDPNIFVTEMAYVDGDVMLDSNNYKLFHDHIVGDPPGIAINLMLARFSKKLINIRHYSNVRTIQSVQAANYHSSKDQSRSDKIMIELCKKMGTPKKFYQGTLFRSRKLHLICSFKLIGSPWQKCLNFLYYLYYSLVPRREFILFMRFRGLVKRLGLETSR